MRAKARKAAHQAGTRRRESRKALPLKPFSALSTRAPLHPPLHSQLSRAKCAPSPPPHLSLYAPLKKQLQDVEGLGKTGVEASVRPGYARNALLPSGAAELVPHRRARREARPPRSMLQEHLQQASEEDEAAAGAKAAAAAATATTTDETSPSRLVAVARSLSKGALESVRPLKMDKKGDDVSTRSSHKIAEPIDAETLVAAVASQKRISLAPELVILEKPIDEQGEHFVPLRMKLGGERVVMRALVGLAAASGGGNEKKGRKKKGGKR